MTASLLRTNTTRRLLSGRWWSRNVLTLAHQVNDHQNAGSSVPLRRCLRRPIHFGTQEYAACFRDLPHPDRDTLRQETLSYLESFQSQTWYDDPIVSLVNGAPLSDDDGKAPLVSTINALGQENGHQIMASPAQVEHIKSHIRSLATWSSSSRPPRRDARIPIRRIEQELLSTHAGFLIGNQSLDFMKQDGVTELEEAIMANIVERRLNDLLWQGEVKGQWTINRRPIYVSCVSNFTNFLDLSRKTLRSLELGIPCIILGRSQTSQHAFRWTQLLVQLMQEQNSASGGDETLMMDPRMITFLSCHLADIQGIVQSCAEHTGNLYATCSRQLAADIKSMYPNTVASTGGPNTMVNLEMCTGAQRRIEEAIQKSTTIESSGQCTALRHCVVPTSTSGEAIQSVFDKIPQVPDASTALQSGVFDAIFTNTSTTTPNPAEYQKHDSADAYFKVSEDLPAPDISEYWRQAVVDFTKLNVQQDPTQLNRLARWLNENQPISLAVNGKRKDVLKVGIRLFERTGLVVNTLGSSDDDEMPPALTCQARPQEGEVFGEFPPRSQITTYTKFPVIVPSSNPSYDTQYTREFLMSQQFGMGYSSSTKALLNLVNDPAVRGYCILLIDYLRDVARFNPKHGYGLSRTTLWGLQRPPLGTVTLIRCEAQVSWDDVAPIYMLFHTTTARDQVELSIDPNHATLKSMCREHRIRHTIETSHELQNRVTLKDDVYHTVNVTPGLLSSYALAGNFVSLYFPLGHIKSTKPEDEEFLLLTRMSAKWLNTLF